MRVGVYIISIVIALSFSALPGGAAVESGAYAKEMQKARELRNSGKVAESEKIYTVVLEKNHRNVDALVGRGLARIKIEGRMAHALEDFRKAIVLSPDYLDSYVGAATCLRRLARTDEVAAALDAARLKCGNDGKKISYLAALCWENGHWDFARGLDPKYKTMKSPQDIEREEHQAVLDKARKLRTDGAAVESEKVYTDLITKNFRDVDSLVGRGFARLKQDGRAGDAQADFQKVIILSPDYLDAYVGSATCFKRLGRKDEAGATLDKARTRCGDDAKKIQYLAAVCWENGHWDFARGIDEKYVDMTAPAEAEREEYLKLLTEARNLRLDGFVDDAEKIYKSLLEKNDRDVDALAGLAFCKLRDKKRMDSAMADFLRVIELSPDYVDAYIGAAICYRRKDDREAGRLIMNKCREVCRDNEGKSRYLAITAWREGYFPLARSIDEQYKPDTIRDLVGNPTTVRLSAGHSWLENQDDWDEISLSVDHRLRPDITLGGDYSRWWRYGENDFIAGLDASYRYDDTWSGNYGFAFSDIGGFLAEQRHEATLRYRLYRSTYIYAGPRFARYSGDWSRRGRMGLTGYWKDFYLDGSYAAGIDTKDENVSSYSVTVGYDYELRYSLAAGFSSGDETVEFEQGGDIQFRSDTVDSIFARASVYFTETTGISISGLVEERNNELFRRELSLTLFHSF